MLTLPMQHAANGPLLGACHSKKKSIRFLKNCVNPSRLKDIKQAWRGVHLLKSVEHVKLKVLQIMNFSFQII